MEKHPSNILVGLVREHGDQFGETLSSLKIVERVSYRASNVAIRVTQQRNHHRPDLAPLNLGERADHALSNARLRVAQQ